MRRRCRPYCSTRSPAATSASGCRRTARTAGRTPGRTGAARAREPRRRARACPRPGCRRSGRRTSDGSRQGLHGHAELGEQRQVLGGRLAQRGEVVADDHGVDPAEQPVARTEIAEGDLPAAGVAQDRARQGEPERGDRPQRFPRVEQGPVPERGAGPRVEKVQRYLVRVELLELGGKLGALFEALAETEDAAAADLHAGLAHHPQGVPTLLPGVRGDDLREVRPGGFQVVVVPVHAQRHELVDLSLGEHPQRGGDVDVDGVPDRFDSVADLGHQPLVGAPDGGHDAELGRPGRGRLAGRLDQRRDVQPDRTYRRGEQPGLRAEVAVFEAAAGLDRDDAFHLDLGAAPSRAYLMGELERRGEMLVWQAQDGEDAGLVETHAVPEHLGPRATRLPYGIRSPNTASGSPTSRRSWTGPRGHGCSTWTVTGTSTGSHRCGSPPSGTVPPRSTRRSGPSWVGWTTPRSSAPPTCRGSSWPSGCCRWRPRRPAVRC